MPNKPQITNPAPNSALSKRLREGLAIVIGALGLFALLALVTYQPFHIEQSNFLQAETANAMGIVGAWFAVITFYWLGYSAYLLPIVFFYAAVVVYLQNKEGHSSYYLSVLKLLGSLLLILASTGLFSLLLYNNTSLPITAGGWLGEVIASYFYLVFNTTGTLLVLLAGLLCGVTLLTGLSWIKLIRWFGGLFKVFFRLILAGLQLIKKMLFALTKQFIAALRRKPTLAKVEPKKMPAFEMKVPKKQEKPAPIQVIPPKPKPVSIPVIPEVQGSTLPSLNLLEMPEGKTTLSYSEETLRAMSKEVEVRLAEFGVEVKVVAVHPGPVVTRFEMDLAPGIKVSKLSGLAKDLARSLSVTSVRVVEVIPGKSFVGLEVPNAHREIVRLREILSSEVYQTNSSPLTLALGKDIAGEATVANLGKMPHLLVAGTTGSGKSVGINAMILSLLYKATPADVRMIMIDPKMLELSVYDGIPHLLAPVVTDMKEAANALRWCVAEMERRYRLMAALGVRNLAGFNQKIKQGIEKNEPLVDPLWKRETDVDGEPPLLDTLPTIVVIIDELADMMMVVGKKVEELIARIAQKARAAGIHLILATQRPSVDVITGLIKANIPTRMAFQVSSKIDSRTILDQMGADQLLGHGDMLYLAPGTGVPTRVHGAFVADQEVHAVVKAWQAQGQPEYIEDILRTDEDGGDGVGDISGGGNSESDPLYDQAVKIVIETRRASISSIQRKLKIGYNRAACLIEAMEEAGLVSEMQSNGTREVLVPE